MWRAGLRSKAGRSALDDTTTGCACTSDLHEVFSPAKLLPGVVERFAYRGQDACQVLMPGIGPDPAAPRFDFGDARSDSRLQILFCARQATQAGANR
jgi:hypothetical protein